MTADRPSAGLAYSPLENIALNHPRGHSEHDGFEHGSTDFRTQTEPFRTPTKPPLDLPLSTSSLGDERGYSRAVITIGELKIDLLRYEIQIDRKTFRLTPTEFRLLTTMAESPGRVYLRDELLAACRGDNANSDFRTIDVHIRNLRIKLGQSAAWIATIRGFGYSLRDPKRTA